MKQFSRWNIFGLLASLAVTAGCDRHETQIIWQSWSTISAELAVMGKLVVPDLPSDTRCRLEGLPVAGATGDACEGTFGDEDGHRIHYQFPHRDNCYCVVYRLHCADHSEVAVAVYKLGGQH